MFKKKPQKPQAVPEITPPDLFYVSCAAGWLELGLCEDGLKELDLVRADLRDHPDVLNLRWGLLHDMSRWKECLDCAERLSELYPEREEGWVHTAYAKRRVSGGSVADARRVLLIANGRFPRSTTIPFNLACYECQLGRIKESIFWLKTALGRATDKAGRQELIDMALSDSDFEPARAEVMKLAESKEE
jgi:hypothetical protein